MDRHVETARLNSAVLYSELLRPHEPAASKEKGSVLHNVQALAPAPALSQSPVCTPAQYLVALPWARHWQCFN